MKTKESIEFSIYPIELLFTWKGNEFDFLTLPSDSMKYENKSCQSKVYSPNYCKLKTLTHTLLRVNFTGSLHVLARNESCLFSGLRETKQYRRTIRGFIQQQFNRSALVIQNDYRRHSTHILKKVFRCDHFLMGETDLFKSSSCLIVTSKSKLTPFEAQSSIH